MRYNDVEDTIGSKAGTLLGSKSIFESSDNKADVIYHEIAHQLVEKDENGAKAVFVEFDDAVDKSSLAFENALNRAKKQYREQILMKLEEGKVSEEKITTLDIAKEYALKQAFSNHSEAAMSGSPKAARLTKGMFYTEADAEYLTSEIRKLFERRRASVAQSKGLSANDESQNQHPAKSLTPKQQREQRFAANIARDKKNVDDKVIGPKIHINGGNIKTYCENGTAHGADKSGADVALYNVLVSFGEFDVPARIEDGLAASKRKLLHGERDGAPSAIQEYLKKWGCAVEPQPLPSADELRGALKDGDVALVLFAEGGSSRFLTVDCAAPDGDVSYTVYDPWGAATKPIRLKDLGGLYADGGFPITAYVISKKRRRHR